MTRLQTRLALWTCGLVGAWMLEAAPCGADPYLYVRVVSLGGSDTVAVNSAGSMVNFKVQARMAEVGTTNTSIQKPPYGTGILAGTVGELKPRDSGFGTIRLDLKQGLGDQIQVSIDAPVALLNGLDAGLSVHGGVLTDRGNGAYDLIGARGSLDFGVSFLGVPSHNTTEWVDVMRGSFTVQSLGDSALSTLKPDYWFVSEGGVKSVGVVTFYDSQKRQVRLLDQSASDPTVGYRGLTIQGTGRPFVPPAPVSKPPAEQPPPPAPAPEDIDQGSLRPVDVEGAARVVSETGVVDILPDGEVSLTSGSPVWVSFLVESGEATNLLTFDMKFIGEAGGEKLLGVYWDDQLVTVREEASADDPQPISCLLPELYGPGWHNLSFRMDSESEAASTVSVGDITLGFAVPEPATVLVLAVGTLALVSRRRKEG